MVWGEHALKARIPCTSSSLLHRLPPTLAQSALSFTRGTTKFAMAAASRSIERTGGCVFVEMLASVARGLVCGLRLGAGRARPWLRSEVPRARGDSDSRPPPGLSCGVRMGARLRAHAAPAHARARVDARARAAKAEGDLLLG